MAWHTLVVTLGTGAEQGRRTAAALEATERVLARADLLDTGAGGGLIWVLERAAWKQALQAEEAGVRAFRVWDALLSGEPSRGDTPSYISLAADLDGPGVAFDDPAVAGATRSTLASFLPLLGTSFIAVSTLMSDWSHCSGALTAFHAGSDREASVLAAPDPWRAIVPARLYRLQPLIFRTLAPPPGPSTQRYGASNPWPGGTFAE
jgi:hypothetical protein